MVINFGSGPWLRQPGSIPPPSGGRRAIRGGAVLDLAVLQARVAAGTLDEDRVWVATDRCQRDLENERWDYAEVLHVLGCLQPGDFVKAEWCQVKGGGWYPCDVYRLCYDGERRERNRRGFEVYLKFSMTDDGQLTLVLVSCHGSR